MAAIVTTWTRIGPNDTSTAVLQRPTTVASAPLRPCPVMCWSLDGTSGCPIAHRDIEPFEHRMLAVLLVVWKVFQVAILSG